MKGLRKSTKNLVEDSWFPSQDLNPRPAKYETAVVTLGGMFRTHWNHFRSLTFSAHNIVTLKNMACVKNNISLQYSTYKANEFIFCELGSASASKVICACPILVDNKVWPSQSKTSYTSITKDILTWGRMLLPTHNNATKIRSKPRLGHSKKQRIQQKQSKVQRSRYFKIAIKSGVMRRHSLQLSFLFFKNN